MSGVEFLAEAPTKIQNIIGKDWDILTFDPREFRPTSHPSIDFSDLPAPLARAGGVGLSGPVLKQFTSANEESAFWESVMRPGAFESHGNLTLSNDVGFL